MCGNEQNTAQIELIGGRGCDRQMSVVDGIEGAAEKGESMSAQSSPN
jgi:hypothetical protein